MELQFCKEEEAETLNSKKMPTLGWTKVAFAVSLLLRCRIFRVVHAPLLDEQLQVRYYPGQMFRSCSYYALIPPVEKKSLSSVLVGLVACQLLSPHTVRSKATQKKYTNQKEPIFSLERTPGLYLLRDLIQGNVRRLVVLYQSDAFCT